MRAEDGQGRYYFPADVLDPYVEWVPYSVEMETGLGTLLEISRLADQNLPGRGTDWTTQPMARDLDGYLWKATSPATSLATSLATLPAASPGGGIRAVSPFPGNGSPFGHAVFAERLAEAVPLLPVPPDGRLDTAASCEAFAERVFARARLRELFTGPWRPRDLVDFHARHKLQLLAHDPVRYRQAGRMVARAGALPPREVEKDYRHLFNAAMADPATRGRHTSVLQRLFGHADDPPDGSWRRDVLATIEAYRRGALPLSIPLTMLARHAGRDRRTWAAGQTYLAPFPAGLRLSQRMEAG
ncbi:YbgA family protein [Actinomadura scrupuli]|uniref:YbgA family protein n=1 Tax=Actinomadura scrupuli TaxID=559629 RepID=UPI003D99DC5E